MKADFTNYDTLYNESRHHVDLYGLTYFKPHEFNHFELMNPLLLVMLDQARSILGKPIYITSSFRTAKENKSCGGASDSSHLTGDAVDIHCVDSDYRFVLLLALLKVGFRRIGIYPNHIHVDVKQSPDGLVLPAQVWYGSYKLNF